MRGEINLCQMDDVRVVEKGGENIGAADDHDRIGLQAFRLLFRQSKSCFNGMRDVRAGGGKFLLARDDDRLAPGQRPANGIPSSSPHDNRLSHRQRSEVLEIGREPPRQRALAADDAVLRDGNDKGEFQTAIGALIAGSAT